MYIALILFIRDAIPFNVAFTLSLIAIAVAIS